MTDTEKEKTEIEKVGEDLFNYAIDREDVKWLVARLPETASVKPTTVEYELQILKIVGVGWSLSYYLETSPVKNTLMENYWNAINEFSRDLSVTTKYMAGQDIDYFEILKERLNLYVETMAGNTEATEPAEVIGPEFARLCGNGEDLFAFMSSSKLFMSVTQRVKAYLEAVKLR